jgi:uncharacterized membrane protein
MSRIFILIGAIFIAIGVLLEIAPRGLGIFSWFGNLPGDIYIRSENSVVFIPWVSMLLVSILFSVGLWIVRWIFGFGGGY